MDSLFLMLMFTLPFLAVWVVLWLGVWLICAIFFLLNLRDLLQRVSPQNRAMVPNQVWLNLIPLFNLVWIFITVSRVRESLQAEYQSRGWTLPGDFGYGLGLAAAILSILNWGVLGLAGFICWIIYWVKMSEFKNVLRQAPAGWIAAQRGPVASVPAGPTGPTAIPAGSCPFCGTPHGPGARFCCICGRSIA